MKNVLGWLAILGIGIIFYKEYSKAREKKSKIKIIQQ